MDIDAFEKLPEREQLNILYSDAVYVGKKRSNGRICLLYQLNSFYVELAYRSYRRHIEQLRCFDGVADLDPYLEQIALSELEN